MKILKILFSLSLPLLVVYIFFGAFRGFEFNLNEYENTIFGAAMIGATCLGIANLINVLVDIDGHETLTSFIPFVVLSCGAIVAGFVIYFTPTSAAYGIAVTIRYLYLPAVSVAFVYNYIVAGFGLTNSYYRIWGPTASLIVIFILGLFCKEPTLLIIFVTVPSIALIVLIIFSLIYRRLPNGTWKDGLGEAVGDKIYQHKSGGSSKNYSSSTKSSSSNSSSSGLAYSIESNLRGTSGYTYNNYVEAYVDSVDANEIRSGFYDIDIYIDIRLTSYADNASSQSEIDRDTKRAVDDLLNEVKSKLNNMGVRYRLHTH